MKTAVHAFALACVAATSIFVMYMIWWLTTILSAHDWCYTAIGAGKATDQNALTACIGLLTLQVKALATNSHMFAGVIALCLLVLMVIVVAGGKLSFKASRDGIDADIGRDGAREAAVAATAVAGAAVKKAGDIIEGEAP